MVKFEINEDFLAKYRYWNGGNIAHLFARMGQEDFTEEVETKLCSNEEQFLLKMITEDQEQFNTLLKEQDEIGLNPIMKAAYYNKDDILDYLCKMDYTHWQSI